MRALRWAWIGLVAAGIGAGAAEGDVEVRVGDTEAAVVRAWGQPSGVLQGKGRKTLVYGNYSAAIEGGKVVALNGKVPRKKAPEAEAAKPAAGTGMAEEMVLGRAPPPESKDVRALMDKIRATAGVEKAYAVEACRGEWAAPAVPLLATLLEDTTPFEIVTYIAGHQSTRGGTSMGQIAADSLGTIGMEAWRPCMEVLGSGSAFGRANAAQALEKLRAGFNPGDEAFYPRLVATFNLPLMEDGNLSAKTRMAHILENVPTPEALAALHRSLGHANIYFAGAAAEILGRRKDPDSIAPLARTFFGKGNAYVREKAGDALGLYADAAAGRAVMAGAKSPDAAMRKKVAEILGGTKDETFAPTLAGMLKDKDADVRRAAVRALGFMPGGAATIPLIEIAMGDPSEYSAQDAYNLLSGPVQNNTDPAVVAAILPGLKHADAKRRAWFAALAGRTGAPEAFEALARTARKDPDEDVRERALVFLDNFKDPRRMDVFLESLAEDDAPGPRRAAMQSVKYGSLRERQEEILLGIVRGGGKERAVEAAFICDELHLVRRNPELLSVFVDCLGHSDAKTRERAMDVLCQEANVPRFGAKGRELGGDAAKWKAWWREQGVEIR